MSTITSEKKTELRRSAILVLVGIIIGAVATAAVFLTVTGRFRGVSVTETENMSAQLTEMAYEVLAHVADGDWKALAAAVHPERGVKFSPYATLNEVSLQQFNEKAVAAFGRDKTSYVWGVYDGSAEPIEMTPPEYFERFVYDEDYLVAPMVGINRVVRSGNALENIAVVYPDMQFVDFHVPPESEDGEWSSLRLGFEEYRGRLRLSLILHSERTA